ncbi:Proteasome lid subunit RPN8/RPN11, contains Jab1/MPN metalloenzyme (JAMM) motif [Haloarcula vallismortis]|uniref:Proteasome lid subunit RPN8/RPN11, contains Jab1/MPN metalloenzyme (JAMM) motif n=1 Tax=Haloarcula vallismortis TaxID=28442 RepID=A0A1H2ZF78_HALVA|nr:Proteasome lid subunit RPN8/RPN11, contains Jab1/MPN metalloenzyme (JAMM) motif [Haloarcula vallismortis]
MATSRTHSTVRFSHRVRALTIPDEIRDAIAARIAASHPHEAGGYLACTRRDDRLYATDHVPLDNVSPRPRRRFVATATDDVPPEPRVFYHSHTSASTPSGLTGTDRRNIRDRFALVVFAPHGEPYSYRLFRLGVVNWREVPVMAEESTEETTRLPRLV